MNGEMSILSYPLAQPLAYDPSFKGRSKSYGNNKVFTRYFSIVYLSFFRLWNFVFFCSVEVRLHEPLWKVQFSPDDVALELLTLCSQLEVLCKKEYTVIL